MRSWILWTALVVASVCPMRAAAQTVVNDGTSSTLFAPLFGTLYVQNANCNATLADPCVAPGAATTVTLVGSFSALTANVRESSVLRPTPASVLAVNTLESATLDLLSGGSAVFVSAAQQSTIQLDTLSASLGISTLSLNDSSTCQLSSGRINTVTLNGQSALTNAFGFVGSATLHDQAQFALELGELQSITLNDDAVFTMTGGQVVAGVTAKSASTTVVSDGVVNQISASDGASVTIRGGVGFTVLLATGSATLRLEGSAFALDGVPASGTYTNVMADHFTGTLDNGDVFDTAMAVAPGAILELVPEPTHGASLASCLLALAALRRSRRA